MLAWIGTVVFGDAPVSADRRRRRRDILRRSPFLSLEPMARLALRLIYIRGIDFARLPRRPRGPLPRDFTGAGFRRRVRPRQLRRSILGSELRRALRHRDLRTRFAMIVAAFADLDTHARAFARRLKRGFPRIMTIVAVRPPGQSLPSVDLGAPVAAADTS